jgi:lipopolysaccharide export system permease protein
VSTLGRYLNRMLLLRFVVVAFAVIGFAAVVDLLDVGDDLVVAPEGAARAGLRYLALRLPMMLSELMPLAALIAAILAVGDLLRHRELVVVWGAGVSNVRVMRLLLPMALLLAGAKLLLDDRAVPFGAAALRAWGIGDFKDGGGGGGGDDPGASYWLRVGKDILRVSANAASAGRLLDLTLLRRDANGVLTERVDAARAEPTAGGLRLFDAVRRAPGTRRAEALATYDWPAAIDLDRVRLLATPPRELGAGRLIEILRSGSYGARAAEPYLTALHLRVAGALVPALLLLLAFALARRFSRTASIAPILVAGITLGFGSILAGGVASALGEVGVVPPALAAWAPPLALAVIVLVIGLSGSRHLRPA